MRAIVIKTSGGPEQLVWSEVPTPEPGTEQVRVRVLATAVNRADVLQRKGLYPAPPGVPREIPGLEFVGVIDAVGPGATAVVGQRVFGLVGGGSYAEYVVVHERTVVVVPPELSDEEAAAIPEAFVTAHDALCTQGQFRTGDRVLVHAVGSGVGIAAVQLAAALHARVVAGTARSEAKRTAAQAFGLTHALTPENFDKELEAQTGAGVDVVIDFVGAGYLARNLRSLRSRGRLVLVGTLGGARDEIDLSVVLRNRLHIVGTVLRARPLEEKIVVMERFAREVVPLFSAKKLRPVVDAVLPLEQAAEAHARMERNETFGKLVLRLTAP